MKTGRTLALLAACCAAGCAAAPPSEPPSKPVISVEVYRRAEAERADRLEREVKRLRDDLERAEEAVVAAESGLRGSHSRADAVSSLAAARIQVERAAVDAPWRAAQIREARAKLEEADRQVKDGHFGAALFFVYRARRIADQLTHEAEQANAIPGTRFVKPRRLNLRAGPSIDDPVVKVLTRGTPVFPEERRSEWILVRTASGSIGWVHHALVQSWPRPSGPAAVR
ncbi:MAG: SH3 domain-containing protein [Myxococcota bacterium]